MATADNCQKIKLLSLMEMLWTETDEQHPLRTSELCARLACKGITCDRRTLARDVRTLNEQSYEVMDCMMGHEKGYYVEDRPFSPPELRILIDMVNAAEFLSAGKSAALIAKLASLGGGRAQSLLAESRLPRNPLKHHNDGVLYHVMMLDDAIRDLRRVSFLYFDLDERARRVYRHGGARVCATPVSTLTSGDRYYLICLSDARPGLSTYRIDRMDSVAVLEETVEPAAIPAKAEVEAYRNAAFKLFGGPEEKCVLSFSDHLIGAIFDRFGEETAITRVSSTCCTAEVTVRVSPTFWGWLFQYSGAMNITAPVTLAQEYIRRCQCASEGQASVLPPWE